MDVFVDMIEKKKQIDYELLEKLLSPLMIKQPHCFWGGREAKKRAHQETTHKSDKEIPLIRELFIKIRDTRKKMGCYDPLLTEVAFWVSRLYALHTIGIPKIFIAQDKETEEPGYTVGTNLWEAELPTLWELVHKGEIEDIHLYLYQNKVWKGPISLKNGNIDIPVWRRTWHPLDDPSTKLSFVERHFEQKDFDFWRTQPPRKGINLRKLVKFIRIWKGKVTTKKIEFI
jgi:hypothetical protein